MHKREEKRKQSEGVRQMATIQDRLSALASTTEEIGGNGNLTAEQLAEEKRRSSVTDFSMVTFSLAGRDYAIDIMKVKERAKAGYFTYVPNSLPFVLGVYNLRGDIIPVIDLRLFFNIEVAPHEDDKLENMLIVIVGDQTFGVVVDEIDRVVGIQKSTIQPPHPLFGDINIKYISGVVEADRNLYVLLDIDRIFGVRTPEEEQQLAETAKAQLEKRQALADESVAVAIPDTSPSVDSAATVARQKAQQAAEEQRLAAADLSFIADSLRETKKFNVNPVTQAWMDARYVEWKSLRGKDKTQLQNESDSESFLSTFYSMYNGGWWSEKYANEISKSLPENTAKNIVVWNVGCGKGYESYSLACILKKKYPAAHIRVYAHDIDLLNVSNAPLLTVSEDASRDWYQPYLTKTVSSEWTFNKEIKDMIMFEYHDCVNTNNLPDIDIIFSRDVVSFLPNESQKILLDDFKEKLKGNGVVIVGEHEDISSFGFTKKSNGSIALYTK